MKFNCAKERNDEEVREHLKIDDAPKSINQTRVTMDTLKVAESLHMPKVGSPISRLKSPS